MAFGADVRRLRKARGLSLEELAERAGLSRNYLATLETKSRDPSLSTVQMIAKGLGVVPAELVGGRTTSVSVTGLEAARMFDRLPEHVQDAVLGLLRSLLEKAADTPRPRKGPRRATRT